MASDGLCTAGVRLRRNRSSLRIAVAILALSGCAAAVARPEVAVPTPTLQASSTCTATLTPRPTPTESPSATPSRTPTATSTPTATWTPTASATPTPVRVAAQVQLVVDGDTIEVMMGGERHTVRYIGMDAPEQQGERMGPEASVANRALVEGKTVYLEKDHSEADKYGRLLRYVFVGDVFVNAELVRQGLARAQAYPPDLKYQEQLAQLDQEARQAGRGMWAAPPTATLGAPQASGCPQGCTAPSTDCRIKGNISKTGERIYHMPGQRYYDQTTIDPNSGERWFCTEEEAQANGWRKSKV